MSGYRNLIIPAGSGAVGALTNVKVSAGTSSANLSAITFSNSNGVSFGLSGSTLTGSVQTNYQTPGAYLTTAALSGDTTKYVQNWKLTGNTSGTTSSAQGTDLWFSGGNSLTVSGNSNTIVFSVGAYLTTAMLSAASTQFVQANAGFNGTNASGTIASNAWSVSVAAQSTQSAIKAFGASNTGNIAGNTGVSTGIDWVLAGSNNITISESTAVGGPNTLWVSGPSAGVGVTASYWRNAAAELVAQTQTLSVQGSTSYIQPFVLEIDLSASYIRFLHSFAVTNTTSIATTANATGSCSIFSTLWAMLYTQGAGASSLSLKSVASASAGMTQVWSLSANANGSQWTLSQSITHPITGGTSQFTTGVTTSLSNYSLGSLSLTAFTGLQHIDIPFASSLGRSNYWLMYGASSTVSTGGSGANFTQLRISNSQVVISQINSAVPLMGQTTHGSVQLQPGVGSVSTNAIGTTASLGFSNISSSASHPLMPFEFIRLN